MLCDQFSLLHRAARSCGERLLTLLAVFAIVSTLSACGGGGGSGSTDAKGNAGVGGATIGDDANGNPQISSFVTINGSVDAAGNPSSGSASTDAIDKSVADLPTSRLDAVRFLEQAGFGPNEDSVIRTMQRGARKQLLIEFAEPASRYTYTLPTNGYRAEIDTLGLRDFCARFSAEQQSHCWRDWYSVQPVAWDFYRQAAANRDQLRQRMAFALSQIFVISAYELDGSYGLAHYHQMLRDLAFGDIRTLLRSVALSPMMGRYLNMVDNDAIDPNENFARELLQLFTVGTCELNADGTLRTGQCVPTYDNTVVRDYAYALSGWTFPAGGTSPWCNGQCDGWKNPRLLIGELTPAAGRHDTRERTLMSNVKAPAGRTAQQGLDAVLDSILAHPNLAPFLGRQLIQHLVTSNPSTAYVGRVSAAFNSGSFADAGGSIGSGVKGCLKATLAAILLDPEARDLLQATAANHGRLKDPIQIIVAAIRALDGVTDGARFGQWGNANDMGQPTFSAPSVFNFYAPDVPLPGTDLVAPQFGLANANTAMARINFANDLVYWWYNKGQGLSPESSIPNAIGTRVSYARWENLIDDAGSNSIAVVDRLGDLLTAGRLSSADKQSIVAAMDSYTSKATWLTNADNRSTWQRERVKTAVYLMLSSPQYQVQR